MKITAIWHFFPGSCYLWWENLCWIWNKMGWRCLPACLQACIRLFKIYCKAFSYFFLPSFFPMCLLTFYPLWHYTQKASHSVIPAAKAELISWSVGHGVVLKDHTQRAHFLDLLPNTPEDWLDFLNTLITLWFICFFIFLSQTHLAPPFSSAAISVLSCISPLHSGLPHWVC